MPANGTATLPAKVVDESLKGRAEKIIDIGQLLGPGLGHPGPFFWVFALMEIVDPLRSG